MKRIITGVNDLATVRPDLLKEWNFKKNDDLGFRPETITPGSGKIVWWKCSVCGFEYKKKVCEVNNGHGCKLCAYRTIGEKNSGIFAKRNKNSKTVADYPEIAKEWDNTKNGDLTPDIITSGSEKKIWWLCPKGHSYQAMPSNRINLHSNCPYCSGKKVLAGFNDLASQSPEVLEMWDFNKNIILPTEITAFSSKKKIWWKCSKCGYEWQATPNRMSNGETCPQCSSSLRTSLPEQALFYYLSKVEVADSRVMINGWEVDIFLPEYSIAIEYDGIYYHQGKGAKEREKRKNEDLLKNDIHLIRVKESLSQEKDTETTIYYDRSKTYKQFSEAIKKVIDKVSQITGKPYVLDVDFERDRTEILSIYKTYVKKRSIIVTNPEITKEWNTERNGSLNPDMFTSGSSEKVWWKCVKGHEWKATIASRAAGAGCPYCSGFLWKTGEGDLLTKFPEIAAEWDYEKNGDLKPEKINPGYKNRVWWICPKGHSYDVSPLNRTTNHCGCPFCSNKRVLKGYNDLETRYPEIAAEWDYEKNNDLKPDGIVYGSNKMVWWKCSVCGKEYEKKIIYRTRYNSKCVFCKNKERDS